VVEQLNKGRGREGGEEEMKVEVHQGFVLSPLLFTIVLETLSRQFRKGLPWELFYADDLVLLAVSRELLVEKIGIWKEGLKSKGLRVNVAKAKVMKCHVAANMQVKSGTRVEYVGRVLAGTPLRGV